MILLGFSPAPSRTRTVLGAIGEASDAAVRLAGDVLRPEVLALAENEVEFTLRTVGAALPGRAPELPAPPGAALGVVALEQPFQGGDLGHWIAGMAEGRRRRVAGAVRAAAQAGSDARELRDRVIGTARAGYRDGVLEVSRRSLATVARTAVAHATSGARELVLLASPDLFAGVRWVAALETGTTSACGALDGRVFPIGEGPRPPAHLGCGSTTAPVLRGFAPAERTTYEAWLRRQSAADQDEALGATRGALFRRGDLPLDRLSDDAGNAYTLDELRRRDRAAFRRAGLPPTP